MSSNVLTAGLFVLSMSMLGGCAADTRGKESLGPSDSTEREASVKQSGDQQRALFAGGCFWCMQPPFDALGGVSKTTVGYAGGPEVRPTYEDVASGRTGHTEAILIDYDPAKISYGSLLDVFWRNIDPTDADGQFVDRGRQYRPAIFFFDDSQRDEARASSDALAKSGRFSKPIAVEIVEATQFYPAETYHQSFYRKNPTRYYSYRRGSGRDAFIEKSWGSD